jgi:hypothetical protein
VGAVLPFKSGIVTGDHSLDGKEGTIESLRPLTASVVLDDGNEITLRVSRKFFLLDGEGEAQVESPLPPLTQAEIEADIEAEIEIATMAQHA